MPRKSAAELSVITPLGSRRTRLRPPATLGEAERDAFVAVVNSCDPGHFRQSDLPLLCRYAESIVLAELAACELRQGVVIGGRVSPWIIIQEKAIRACVALSMRLRLSPQARQPNNPSRKGQPAPSHYDLMREENNGDDD